MAVDKLVDSAQLDADLTSVANAIRTKGGTSASLTFPSGFVTAIGNISGGGGLTFDWADVEEVTIGANSVASTTAVSTYFSGYTYSFVILASALTTTDQFVFGSCPDQDGVMGVPHRYRGGKIVGTIVGANYDAKLVEGTKYYLLKRKA